MTILKLLCALTLTLTVVSALPIDRTLRDETKVEVLSEVGVEVQPEEENVNTNAISDNVASKMNNLVRMPQGFRPGMQVNRYEVEITPNGDSFNGILRAQISITDPNTRDQDIKLFVEDLEITSVQYAFVGGTLFTDAQFSMNDDHGTVDIDTGVEATLYNFDIRYTGSLDTVGLALYAGGYGDTDYLAMNLYAQNARRVFPCVDIPTQPSLVSFTFNNVDSFNNIVMNSMLVENEASTFMPLRGPTLLWTMVAHNFNSMATPTANVQLFVRPGVPSTSESLASIAITDIFNNLNEWTNVDYFDIIPNQRAQLQIMALPDISKNWYGLSSIGIWEPYVIMDRTAASALQRFTGLSKIAEALARPWFGYALYPANFRYQWVISGLASYAGFDLLRTFQTPQPNTEDISMLDINTLFVTEVIQESLLRDGYIAGTVMEPAEIFNQDVVRENMNGILNYKAPAIMRMLRLALGDADNDFIQTAGRALLAGRSVDQPQTVDMLAFVDAVNTYYVHNGNGFVGNVEEYLQPFVQNNGCPLLVVQWRQGGVSLNLERFNFLRTSSSDYSIPITYSISNAANYEESAIYPGRMLGGTDSIDMLLQDDDYVLFNVQGQGYYRVLYDNIFSERILEALQDPDRRDEIHPLNRATLIDDALNLARGGRVTYESIMDLVLTWEHETEYAPWKAFVRNMDFLRKHLEAMVAEDDDLDQDIYLRMVRRTIGAFEDEIGFIPDPQEAEPAMTSLTRGLVMDHACRAGYQPCIAAALDLFYDDDVVNPNIPTDIRPAVYCTAVRENDMEAVEALLERLEIENIMWERVVILESLACSDNRDYINGLLMDTISESTPYTAEERNKIFIAVARSSYQNAQAALDFLNLRVNEIRDHYGGDEKLENIVNELAENVVDSGFADRFRNFVISSINNLDDAQHSANRARQITLENSDWERRFMQEVYDWIDENDAPTLMVSLTLMIFSCVIALVNH